MRILCVFIDLLCGLYRLDPVVSEYVPTIGIDFSSCYVDFRSSEEYSQNIANGSVITQGGTRGKTRTLSLNLWDTGGENRFEPITKMHYRGAQILLVCYDRSSDSDIESSVARWVEDVQQGSVPQCKHVLFVGTKSDLPPNKNKVRKVEEYIESLVEQQSDNNHNSDQLLTASNRFATWKHATVSAVSNRGAIKDVFYAAAALINEDTEDEELECVFLDQEQGRKPPRITYCCLVQMVCCSVVNSIAESVWSCLACQCLRRAV